MDKLYLEIGYFWLSKRSGLDLGLRILYIWFLKVLNYMNSVPDWVMFGWLISGTTHELMLSTLLINCKPADLHLACSRDYSSRLTLTDLHSHAQFRRSLGTSGTVLQQLSQQQDSDVDSGATDQHMDADEAEGE